MSHEYEGEQYDDEGYEPQCEGGFLAEGDEGYYEHDSQEDAEGQEAIDVNVPAMEDYPSFDDIGLTDNAILIVEEFVFTNGHLRVTAEDVAEVMRDNDGNEHVDSIEFARMVLDVWRMRNPDLETIEEEYPRGEAPEPVQQEEYYEDQNAAEYYEGQNAEEYYEDQYEHQPQDDQYDLQPQEGEYEAQPGVMEMEIEPEPEPEPEPQAMVYEEAYGANYYQGEDEGDYGAFVPQAVEYHEEERYEERYEEPMYEGEEGAYQGTYQEGPEVSGHYTEENVIYEEPVYAEEGMEYGAHHHVEAEPEHYIEGPQASYGEVEMEYESMHQEEHFPQASPVVREESITYTINVPSKHDFPVYHEIIDFAARLVENFVVTNGNLKLTPEELAPSILEPDGLPTVGALDVAEMVLEIWANRNPHLEAYPLQVHQAPRPVPASAPKQELTAAHIYITVPHGDDYPRDRLGFVGIAARLVRSYVLQHSNLTITEGELAEQMAEFVGGDRRAEIRDVAGKVLDVWRRRNPDLPMHKAKATPAPEVIHEVIAQEIPREHSLTTIALAGGHNLVIPPETDYASFDRSGLTDDAIRIVREFVTDTGSLGITEELIAAQMVDFMGNQNPDVPIASMVLNVWRQRNPHLPLTSVKEIYPGVIEAEQVSAPRAAAPVAPPVPEPTSAIAIVPITPKQAPEATSTTYGATGKEFVHVEREDDRDEVYGPELQQLLERFGFQVEPFVCPMSGPLLRFTTISSKSIIYRSGVEPGDAIMTLEGMAVTKLSQLYSMLSRMTPGSPFTWRLRRINIVGDISEWCVMQTVPTKKMRAVEERFAGIPRPEAYRSHSGMLPTDPGFHERYSKVPDYIVQGPQHVETKKYWDTRVVRGGTFVVPHDPVALLEAPKTSLPSQASVAIATPPSAPVTVGPAEGIRTVYRLEGSPVKMPMTVPYQRSTIAEKPAAAPVASSTYATAAAEGTRTVYPLNGPPVTMPLSAPYARSATVVTGTIASPRQATGQQVTTHRSPVVVTSTAGSVVRTVARMPAADRVEHVYPTSIQVDEVRARMVRKYEASITRDVEVTEERVPVSAFLPHGRFTRRAVEGPQPVYVNASVPNHAVTTRMLHVPHQVAAR